MVAPLVSIVIPTQRRPAGLARAARSTFGQRGVDPTTLELVVVDNDLQPSAQGLVEELASAAPFPIVYVHEPRPGVAHARNAALAQARGALIAFLDDDEEATHGWLAALLDVQARFDADVVFGRIEAALPPRAARHGAYFADFFARRGPAEAGLIEGHYGCGDSLLRRAALPTDGATFDLARNEIGGEDNLLFVRMRAAGARFAWAPEALVFERPEPARVTARYALRRAIAYGQAAPADCAAASPPDWAGVLRWMLQGLAQATVFGAFGAAQWLVRSPRRLFTLERAARGLGKVFWGGPFRMRFYGQRPR
ncbi:MAG: glycosyltransferase family 2 protein [Phenylobacterium sp.]